MVKFNNEVFKDINDIPGNHTNQPRGSERLRYIPYKEKWAIPLSMTSGCFVPALADWDSSSFNPDDDMFNEKYGGVVVIALSELNEKRSENIRESISEADHVFIRKCIEVHGISYPTGTPNKHKVT